MAIAALKILQSGDIARAQGIGLSSGAMGQTQVLPSNFLAYAVDGQADASSGAARPMSWPRRRTSLRVQAGKPISPGVSSQLAH